MYLFNNIQSTEFKLNKKMAIDLFNNQMHLTPTTGTERFHKFFKLSFYNQVSITNCKKCNHVSFII